MLKGKNIMPVNAPEIITVAKDVDEVVCDGGGGALGHPKTWYVFDDQGKAQCSYCDRLFKKRG